MNMFSIHSFWRRTRIILGAIAIATLSNSFAPKAHAQAWEKMESTGSTMVTIGITEDGKYPIYQLKVTPQTLKNGQFPSDATIFSTEELPAYLIRIQKSDVNKNGYKCANFCFDKFGNLVGLNPERYTVPAPNSLVIQPIDHEKKYKIYPIDGSDLNDIGYNYRNYRYSPKEILTAIPPIKPEDVNRNGYRCDFLCVNSEGQVVGWNPLDKRIGMY